MSPTPEEVHAQLAALRQQYLTTIASRIAEVETAWAELKDGTWQLALARELSRLMHGFVGSGATYGLPALSTTARGLEELLRVIVHDDATPASAVATQVDVLFASLRTVVADGEPRNDEHCAALAPCMSQPASSSLIALIGSSVDESGGIRQHLGHFGYATRAFEHFAAMHEALGADTRPSAIIIGLAGLADMNTSSQASLQYSWVPAPPLLVVSARSDLPARLEAVRAGGSAFFVTPVDSDELIDTLDRLTVQRALDPYRILIVDDDPALASYYAVILEGAGMLTAVVTDPLQVSRLLVEFRPDLVLTDMYMPGCTGLELAAVIRQQAAYISIPIMFLSAEADPARQFAAMELGGDNFLTKPILPGHLVSAVVGRAHRARILRDLMTRDSLTGLLNHTRTREQLEIELARAARQERPLALAMIDIDHFKTVNDTYGHPVGDRVIKSLAWLLQQRLRRTDSVGRYGGEEFAVILPDNTPTTAAEVLNDLREGFAQLLHYIDGTRFSVTFSCGIAGFPELSDAAAMTRAADETLYLAKRGGRNRIVVWSDPNTSSS